MIRRRSTVCYSLTVKVEHFVGILNNYRELKATSVVIISIVSMKYVTI